MQCALPPHRETLSFTSYEDYEVHYQQAHVNRCSQCSKNFPTGHFLNLHIEENHDPLASARRARGDKTVCDVAGQTLLPDSDINMKLYSLAASLKCVTGNALLLRSVDFIL
jgi:hypothetical protein